MMDVVYPFVIDAENNSDELRYSLRSLVNIPHNTVHIVGDRPDWITNVNHIPVPQTKTKYENVRLNILTAISRPEISDDFIFMNDDFFIMNKLQEIPTLNFGDMSDLIKHYRRRYPDGSTYVTAMSNTYDMLVRQGIPKPISYELHVPHVVNKSLAKRLLNGRIDPSIHFRSMYGNTFSVGGTTTEDVKIFIDPAHNDPAYNQDPESYMKSQQFISATGGAFKRGLAGDFIRKAFPNPSIYESSDSASAA